MDQKPGGKSTPKNPPPQGFRPGAEVAAAGGGRTVVGNEIAKGVRKALWQDRETGAWHEFSNNLDYFRVPAYDSIFTTSLWTRTRQRGGYGQPLPSPLYENVFVVVSVLATDKPIKPVPRPRPVAVKKRKKTTKVARAVMVPPAPPKPRPKRKKKKLIDPAQNQQLIAKLNWLANAIIANPQREVDTVDGYAQRLHLMMRTAPEVKPWKTWSTLRRQLYALRRG
jgi:hypothetical protein